MKNMRFVKDDGPYKAGEIHALDEQTALNVFIAGSAVNTEEAPNATIEAAAETPVADEAARLAAEQAAADEAARLPAEQAAAHEAERAAPEHAAADSAPETK